MQMDQGLRKRFKMIHFWPTSISLHYLPDNDTLWALQNS